MRDIHAHRTLNSRDSGADGDFSKLREVTGSDNHRDRLSVPKIAGVGRGAAGFGAKIQISSPGTERYPGTRISFHSLVALYGSLSPQSTRCEVYGIAGGSGSIRSTGHARTTSLPSRSETSGYRSPGKIDFQTLLMDSDRVLSMHLASISTEFSCTKKRCTSQCSLRETGSLERQRGLHIFLKKKNFIPSVELLSHTLLNFAEVTWC